MSDSPFLDRTKARGESDGHLNLGFAAKRSDAIGACLRKSFQHDVDETVPEEFEKLLKALH